MTNTAQLKTASTEITQRNFDVVTDLVNEAFSITDRDSRQVKLGEAKEILKTFNLENSTQLFADSVINASIDEAGGPLDKLKRRTFNKVLDEISKEKNVSPREKIGQFHNDPTWQ